LFPLFPKASMYFSAFIITFNIASMLYAGLITFVQDDIKKIIAYSSIVHMNYLILGLYACELLGWYGSLLTMISHSFVAGGLFLCVGIIYDRYKTRSLRYYNGLVYIMPIWCGILFLFILGNIAFPGTLSFIGEVLTAVGFFQYNKWFCFVILFITLINLVYSILLLARISFLNLNTSIFMKGHDLSRREFLLAFILIFFVFFYGIFPQNILNTAYSSLFSIFI
jgi:NADH-quinone oxidoreductase subunit M